MILDNIFVLEAVTIFASRISIADYPIISIEDPFEQDDWVHTKKLTDLKICQVGIFYLR